MILTEFERRYKINDTYIVDETAYTCYGECIINTVQNTKEMNVTIETNLNKTATINYMEYGENQTNVQFSTATLTIEECTNAVEYLLHRIKEELKDE